MIAYMFAAAVLVAALATDLSAQDKASATTPCKRPAPRKFADGATVVLKETRYPCSVQFVRTGATLTGDHDDKVENISYSVARGPDGRFYTSSNATSAEVSVWNPDGSYLRNFGRLGQGPGEFAAGIKFIQFDGQGRLFIGDNNRRWSIFTPTFQFIAHVPAIGMGIGLEHSGVLLPDGKYIASQRGRDTAFHIYDLSERGTQSAPVVRAFGAGASRNSSTSRPLSYARGATFVAGPLEHGDQSYAIELWETNGKLIRTIRRQVSWMPKALPSTPGPSILKPQMQILHDDGAGLIYVRWWIPKAGYATLSPAERRNRAAGGPLDKFIAIYLEVIDANAGVVLASEGPFGFVESNQKHVLDFFPGGSIGYQYEEDANGFASVRIIQARLVNR